MEWTNSESDLSYPNVMETYYMTRERWVFCRIYSSQDTVRFSVKHLMEPECYLGAYLESFMRGKENRAGPCHGIFLPFFHSPKRSAVEFLAVYYWQRKCWFMGLSYRKPYFLVKKQGWWCCQHAPRPVSATCLSPGPAPRLTEKG